MLRFSAVWNGGTGPMSFSWLRRAGKWALRTLVRELLDEFGITVPRPPKA